MSRRLFNFVLMLAVALLFSSTPARAGKPTTTVIPISEVVGNPCSGENIDLTGTVTMSVDSETKKGILHVRVHTVTDLSGVGVASGINYSVHQVNNQEANVKLNLDGNTGELNVSTHNTIVSHGGADNLVAHIRIHTTSNANGDLIVERTDVDIECVG